MTQEQETGFYRSEFSLFSDNRESSAKKQIHKEEKKDAKSSAKSTAGEAKKSKFGRIMQSRVGDQAKESLKESEVSLIDTSTNIDFD